MEESRDHVPGNRSTVAHVVEQLSSAFDRNNVPDGHKVTTSAIQDRRPPRPADPLHRNSNITDVIWMLMEECWDHIPSNRPTAAQIVERLPPAFGGDNKLSGDWEDLASSHVRTSNIGESSDNSELSSSILRARSTSEIKSGSPGQSWASTSERVADDPSSPGTSGLSSCITADLAFDEVKRKEGLIYDLFQYHHQWGSFYIQAGFNEDIIRLGQGRLQEIYIYLENEIYEPSLSGMLGSLIFPFTGFIFTPDCTHRIPVVPPEGSTFLESDYWNLLKDQGIHRPDLGHESPPRQIASVLATCFSDAGGKPSGGSGSSGSQEPPGRGGDSGSGNNSREKSRASDNDRDGNNRENNGDSGGRGGGDDGGDDDGGPGETKRDNVHPVIISIPFGSTLICRGDNISPVDFKVSSRVDVKVSFAKINLTAPPNFPIAC